MVKLDFDFMWKSFFVSSVVLFLSGFVLVFFDARALAGFLSEWISCVSDAGPIFYWQVLSSHILLAEIVVLNVVFFAQKSAREKIIAKNMSNGNLVFVVLFCLLISYFFVSGVIGYEFQCHSPRFHWFLRYAAFTLGLNAVYALVFLAFFSIFALVRRVSHE